MDSRNSVFIPTDLRVHGFNFLNPCTRKSLEKYKKIGKTIIVILLALAAIETF